MAMLAESVASFKHRATEVRLSAEHVAALLEHDVTSFNTFAFAVCGQPGQLNEGKLQELCDLCFPDGLSIGAAASLRQLAYEAITISVAAIKQRVEVADEAVPRKLPPQERQERQNQQLARLPGLHIHGETEPANSLVDLFCQMVEQSCLRYVALSRCVSREHELGAQRTERQVLVLENKEIHARPKLADLAADTSSELRVHNALVRRGLAADQAGLMTFETHDRIAKEMLAHLTKPTPHRYQGPNIESIMRADKELWMRVADVCRGSLRRTADGKLPVDEAMKSECHHAAVLFHLLPMPVHDGGKARVHKRKREASSSAGSEDPPLDKKLKDKKRKKQRKEDKKGPVPNALKGYSGKTGKGEKICFNYNLHHGCKLKAAGNPCKCSRGLHVCIKCGKSHPLMECDSD